MAARWFARERGCDSAPTATKSASAFRFQQTGARSPEQSRRGSFIITWVELPKNQHAVAKLALLFGSSKAPMGPLLSVQQRRRLLAVLFPATASINLRQTGLFRFVADITASTTLPQLISKCLCTMAVHLFIGCLCLRLVNAGEGTAPSVNARISSTPTTGNSVRRRGNLRTHPAPVRPSVDRHGAGFQPEFRSTTSRPPCCPLEWIRPVRAVKRGSWRTPGR